MVIGAAPAVAQVLEHAARQMAVDGGGLRYLGATPDGYVRLKLTGACATCPRRMMTLDLAIETPLRSVGAARGVELVPSAPFFATSASTSPTVPGTSRTTLIHKRRRPTCCKAGKSGKR